MKNRAQENVYFQLSIAVLAICLSGALWQQAKADEAALYDTAPDSASFIRLVNLTKKETVLKLGGKRLSESNYCHASDYIYLDSGDYDVENNGYFWGGTLSRGQVYSLVVAENGISLIEDVRIEDVSRAQLAVYNFTQGVPLSIRTNPRQRLVFSGLESGQRQSRQANAMKVSLSAFDADKKLVDSDSVILQDGKTSSLLICPIDASYKAQWIQG